MRNKINKIKNFEGYFYNCCRCGREIKHAYFVDNSTGVYGSECIYKIAGTTFHKANKYIKELNFRERTLIKMLKQ